MPADPDLPTAVGMLWPSQRMAELRAESERLIANVKSLSKTHLTFDQEPSAYLAELHRQAEQSSHGND